MSDKQKRISSSILFFFLLVTVITAMSLPAGERAPQGIERLKKQLEAVIGIIDEGQAGVAIKHLESGEELLVNGDLFFPMASVFKIPLFVEVMFQIKEGRFSLEDEISLQKADQHLGSGLLSALDVPGIKLSVRNLINMMMIISDNSATDMLMNMAGASKINKRLGEYGIKEISVDRTCQQLIMDYRGVDYERYKGMTLEEVTQVFQKEMEANPEVFREASKKFSQVLKDQSTPRAMNRLLEMIFKREILDGESCELMLSVLLKCQTGAGRIKAGLPSGTGLAHKTGTIGGTVNDSGIIYLADGLGHVALTVFTKDTGQDTEDVEKAIAQIARYVYDYFYFTTPVTEKAACEIKGYFSPASSK